MILTLVGIEPTIYCLEGSRLIHWATRTYFFIIRQNVFYTVS